MSKTIWGTFIAVVVIVVIVVIGLGRGKTTVGPVTTENMVRETDVVRGNPEAKVTLVEFADFQCPACRTFYPIVEDLVTEFGSSTRFVYKHYPLPQHGHAFEAAYAYEAARIQNKAPEMAKLLFTNQPSWENSPNAAAVYREYAQQIGLNMTQYDIDFKARGTRQVVAESYKMGTELKVDSTPTFFLNGKKIDRISSVDDFKNLIKAEINATK